MGTKKGSSLGTGPFLQAEVVLVSELEIQSQ